jgi:hypothetical protein
MKEFSSLFEVTGRICMGYSWRCDAEIVHGNAESYSMDIREIISVHAATRMGGIRNGS